MNLSELTLPVPLAECKDLALVYPYEVAVALYQVQVEHGDTRHVPTGFPLTDGRWMMYGHILSEVGPGGILHGAFDYVTPEMMATVEIVPLADAVALLPAPPAE